MSSNPIGSVTSSDSSTVENGSRSTVAIITHSLFELFSNSITFLHDSLFSCKYPPIPENEAAINQALRQLFIDPKQSIDGHQLTHRLVLGWKKGGQKYLSAFAKKINVSFDAETMEAGKREDIQTFVNEHLLYKPENTKTFRQILYSVS